MRLRVPTVLMGALVAGACARERTASAVTRDSAGVSIVESVGPADGNRPRYSVDSLPAIEISAATDAGVELGQGVIPTALSDGRIVVANPSSFEIRFYDARGKALKSIGRQGGGPGEFESLGLVAGFAGDSLVAFDVALRRYSVFDDTGAFARSGSLAVADAGLLIPVGAFQDGALVVRVGLPIRPSGFASASIFGGSPAGEQRGTTPLFRAPLDGSPLDSIASMPGSEVLVQASGTAMFVWPIHFGRVPVVAARDSLVVIGDGDGFGLDVRRQNGQLIRRFRRPTGSRPVSPGDLDGLIGEQLATLPIDARESMAARLRETPHRATKPPYDRVVISEVGEIWVRHFVTSPAAERYSTWSVFAAGGEWLCDVAMQAAFAPFAITRDRLLGTWTDEAGELSVRTHRLNRER
jgi:hypothetical protein